MPWTNEDIIKEAFAEIGLGAVAYSLQPEDIQTALRRMNLMLAEWGADGIDVGYTAVDTPDADDFDEDSEINTDAVRAVILNLAIEIAPNYGKQVSTRTLIEAKNGKRRAKRDSITVPAKVLDNGAIPAGAGHKYRGTTILPSKVDS